MHCHRHHVFHASCPECLRARRQTESSLGRSAGAESLLDGLAITTALESITDPAIDSSSGSVSDGTGFSSDSFSGGDFGGGGAGGDW